MAVTGPPFVEHQGLIVPNAIQSASPRMAEPDQIDFATAANAMWGVIEGCHVSVSGTLAHTTGGVVVINGTLYTIREGSVPLGIQQVNDRFDLIAADTTGNVRLIDGKAAVDPVFPDVPTDCTLLASVFCSGPGPYESTCVDKRRFVSKSLLSNLGDQEKLIQNLNGSGDAYRVLGGGRTTWSEDTKLFRSAPKTLTIEDNLSLTGNVTAVGTVQGGTLTATGLVSGANLRAQTTQPATAPLGAIWQDTGIGAIKVMTADGWKSIGFVADMVPAGTVVMSLESVDNMLLKGWVPLDGREVFEDKHPNLFQIDGLLSACPHSGTAPSRKMTLPNANGQMLKVTSDPSQLLATGGSSRLTLREDQMPRHKHGVTVGQGGGASPQGSTSGAGSHTHSVDMTGPHAHSITDPTHNHIGMDWNGNRVSIVALAWGGNNKIDALFNDRNHTYSVEAMDKIYAAPTGISVNTAGSEHTHTMSDAPNHTHPVTISAIAPHTHDVTEAVIGGTAEIIIDPPYIALHAFIRS